MGLSSCQVSWMKTTDDDALINSGAWNGTVGRISNFSCTVILIYEKKGNYGSCASVFRGWEKQPKHHLCSFFFFSWPFVQFQFKSMANKNSVFLLSVGKHIRHRLQFISRRKIDHQPGECTITHIYHQRMQEQNTSEASIFWWWLLSQKQRTQLSQITLTSSHKTTALLGTNI